MSATVRWLVPATYPVGFMKSVTQPIISWNFLSPISLSGTPVPNKIGYCKCKKKHKYLLYYLSISFLGFVSLISSKWCKNYHKINKGFVKCSHIKIKSSIHGGTYCRIFWVNFVIFVIFVTQISCNWSALIDNKP